MNRVEAPIVAVTVYPGQARVTRSGRIALSAGQQRVTVGGLPLRLRADSVRVNGRGPATVLGVDVEAEHNPRSPDATIEELETRLRELRAGLDRLEDDDAVQRTRAEQLESLARRSGSAFAKALAGGTAQPGAVADAGEALAGQLRAVLSGRRTIAEQRRVVQEQCDQTARALADRHAATAPDRMAIVIDLDVAEPGELAVDVSYVVDDASWESRYDLRLQDRTLTLTWYGLLTQNTGEDWPECELRLSTARPAATVTVPELVPWYLDRLHPMPMAPARAVAAQAAPAAAKSMAFGGRAADTSEAFQQVYATVEHGVAASVYQPGRPVAVPSDGTAHRCTVAVTELQATLDHVTVPLRGPEAYLRAVVVNTSQHTLRAGRASVFHDTEFVGTTALEPWAPGEEVELTLGIDDRVRVERELVHRSAGKAVLGGTRKQDVRYRITVGNYGPNAATVTVIDQLPVSRDDGIVLRDVQLSPQPAERTEMGELTWRLELEPGASTEITFGFRVEVGKGVTMTGWRD